MMIRNFDELLSHAATLSRHRVVVVFPNNKETFSAVAEARDKLNVEFDLVGDADVIAKGLREVESNNDRLRVHDKKDIHGALQHSIELLKDGNRRILMKGGIDTSSLMKAVLAEASGLRTGRLLSDIFIMEYPQRQGNKFVMITDGGMTLSPDLANKIELVKNAVDVAHALGNLQPKVAILSATEFVLPNLQSTLDAAALSKMNDRGQIKGCIIDGPLALDNALSPEAAEEKGIVSPVAGHAEILVAANIESANSLAKSTTYFASMRLAHVIVGAKIPILIPSRADKSDAKLLSVALGILMSCFAS
ncbi:MAG TPA: bifunctional enoyl-CoA hydratase/phosphate acetyltransferase [Bacteroidota bacterium]